MIRKLNSQKGYFILLVIFPLIIYLALFSLSVNSNLNLSNNSKSITNFKIELYNAIKNKDDYKLDFYYCMPIDKFENYHDRKSDLSFFEHRLYRLFLSDIEIKQSSDDKLIITNLKKYRSGGNFEDHPDLVLTIKKEPVDYTSMRYIESNCFEFNSNEFHGL